MNSRMKEELTLQVRRRVGKGPGHFRLVAVDVPARRFDVLTSPAGGDDGASVDQGEPGFHCLGNEVISYFYGPVNVRIPLLSFPYQVLTPSHEIQSLFL